MPTRLPSVFLFARFSDPEVLAEALQNTDTRAIEWLLARTEKNIAEQLRRAGLPADLTPDILHDGLLILIKKIRAGDFDTKRATPKTYLIGICKNLISNCLRAKKQHPALPLDQHPDAQNIPETPAPDGLENLRQIEALLQRLGEPCSRLVRLKYLDELRDEEIIAQKLTHFASTDSLKNARSRCMKKLLELAQTMT